MRSVGVWPADVEVSWQPWCRLGGYLECVVAVATCAFAVSETRRFACAGDRVTQGQIAEHRGQLDFLAALVEALITGDRVEALICGLESFGAARNRASCAKGFIAANAPGRSEGYRCPQHSFSCTVPECAG
jgi:hypothetical protein